MAKAPAFQFYASDFLTDTNSWDVAEIGIYIRLLCTQWVNGGVPNDEKRLARIAGVDIVVFKKAWVILALKFSVDEDGLLKNLRLEEVRSKKNSFHEKQSENGKKGGRPKKKQNQSEPKENPSLLNNETQKISQKKPLEDEDEIEKENKEGGMGETIPGDGFFIVLEFQKIWMEYNPNYISVQEHDFEPLRKISEILLSQHGINHNNPSEMNRDKCAAALESWSDIAMFIPTDSHFRGYNLAQVYKYIQAIVQKMNTAAPATISNTKPSALQQNLTEAQRAKEMLKKVTAENNETTY